MGRFSGILIVSDIDGTLYNSEGKVSDKNRRALEYFKSEGGLFTLASGRSYLDVLKIDGELQLANTALIGTNGAVIGDHEGNVLYQSRFEKGLDKAIRRVLDAVDYCDAEFVTPEYITAYRPTEMTRLHGQYVSDRFTTLSSLDDIPEDTAMVSFWMMDDRIEDFKRTLTELGIDREYLAFQGFRYAVEMVPLGQGKGFAARRLKEITNCHTLVCAGDSGNDITMLEAADISFAPSNALPEALAAAKVTLTRSCDESIYEEIVARL